MGNIVFDPWGPKEETYGEEVPCDYPRCTCKAINSHLLQRGVMLKNIAEDGVVLQICDEHMQSLIDEEKQYVLLPIRKAMSLPVFCPQHDSKLFRQMEKGELNVHDDRNILLLSYRALCGNNAQEKRRELFYNINPKYNPICQGELFDIQKDVSRCAIDKMERTIERLLVDIKARNYTGYKVLRYTIERTGICMSDCIYKETELGMDVNGIFSPLFVHVIPKEDCTWVVFLYEKEYVTQTSRDILKMVDEMGVEKSLTELMARTNNWCVSPSLFGDNPQCVAEWILEKRMRWLFED